MELTRKGLGGGVASGLTLTEFARESLHQRARGQPEQERQQERRRSSRRPEMAGTRMYSHRSAFSWDRHPLRQLKNRTFSNHSALLASSLAVDSLRELSLSRGPDIQPVATEVEEVLIFAGITVGRGGIRLALEPAALQAGLVVPDVD